MATDRDLPSSGRALVPLDPGTIDAYRHCATRRQAPFLAHLIATARQEPQTRERRRAEPSEAIAAYEAMKSRAA
jgi:hypothetical protein